MSGITLGEIANDEAMDLVPVPAEHEAMYEAQPSKVNEMFNRVLTAETGEGSIGDYIDHPMNFNNSQGLAQLIRGLSGILGNLNLAIIDVIFGALRFSREKRGVLNGISSRGSVDS